MYTMAISYRICVTVFLGYVCMSASTAVTSLHLETDPPAIREDYSKYLVINCSFDHSLDQHFGTLIKLVLSKSSTSGFNDLGSVSSFDSSKVKVTDTLGADVKGVYSANGVSWISYQWHDPTSDLLGDYQCEALGMDQQGHPRTLSANITVVEKPLDLTMAINKINELKVKLYQLNSSSQCLPIQTSLDLANNDLDLCRQNLTSMTSSCASKTANLNQELSQCRTDKAGLELDVSDLKSRESNLTASLNNCHVDKSNLSTTFQECDQDLKDLALSMNKTSNNATQLGTDLSKCLQDQVNLASEINNCETAKTNLNTSLVRCNLNERQLTSDITNLKFQEKIMNQSLIHCLTDKTNLSNSVKQCKDDLKNDNLALQQILNDTTQLNLQLTDCSNEKSNLSSEISASIHISELLEYQLDTCDIDRDNVNLLLAECKAHNQNLTAQTNDLSSLKTCQDDLNHLGASYTACMTHLNTAQQQQSNLQQISDSCKAENNNLMSQFITSHFEHVSGVFEGHKYYLSYSIKADMTLAQNTCKAIGGTLAEINTSGEYSFMENLCSHVSAPTHTMLGATNSHSSTWTFLSSGKQVDFFHWNFREPTHGRNENCLYYYWTNFRHGMHDHYCQSNTDSTRFLCEVPQGI